MNYELFNPSNPCNPILPLNTVKNSINFFKINVFEVSLDRSIYEDDGIIDWLPGGDYSFTERVKLGIPLTDLFPALRERLRTKFIKGPLPLPIRVGIEGTFIPSEKDHSPIKKITDVFLYADDIKKGKIKLGSIEINVKELLDGIKKNGSVFYKHKDKLYKIQTPPQSITVNLKGIKNSGSITAGDITLSDEQSKLLASRGHIYIKYKGSEIKFTGGSNASEGIGTFNFTPGMSFLIPSTLSDKDFFEILSALIFDPRSGLSGMGEPHPVFNPEAFNDEQYFKVFNEFKKDERYSSYRGFTPGGDYAGKAKLPSYEIGLYTSFEQEWELKGYSRGALLNSITLSPREEVTVEVFTFDRLKLENEKEFTTEFEKNLEISSLSRASSEISRELTTTTDSNTDIGLGIPLPIEGVPVNIDVNAGVSNNVKEGIQSTIERINEATVSTSEKFKSTTRVKVVQSRETGEEKRVIRKIVNPNNSRTLTLNYFEVLETYKVTTSLKDTKKLCILVDNPDFGAFDVDMIMAYEDRLQKALLSQLYIGGFEAAKKLAAQRWFDRRSEIKTEIENVIAGNNTGGNPSPVPPLVRTAKTLAEKLDTLIKADLMKAAGVLSAHYDPFKPKEEKPSRKDVSNAEDTLGLVNFWIKMKISSPGIESKALEFIDGMNRNHTNDDVVRLLESFLTGMDDEWLTVLKMVAINLVSIQLSALLVIPFPLLMPLLFEFALISNDNGLPGLIDKAKSELKNFDILNGTAVSQQAADSSGESGIVPIAPPQLFSLEELAMANAEFEKLVLHLEANRVYYINKILLHEDSSERFVRLQLKGIAGFVENRILGFIGNKTAFPLRMESLDKYSRDKIEKQVAAFSPEKNEKINGIDTKKIEPREEIISLPTNGMHIDSILGQCESLEPYLLERQEIEKQMAKAQADIAVEKAVQQKEETKRLSERIKQGQLDNPLN